MSVTKVVYCDWCGEEIVDDDRCRVELTWSGSRYDPDGLCERKILFEEGPHLHAGKGRDCYLRVRELLELMLETAPAVNEIPTVTSEEVERMRRQHRRHGSQS